jgi:hypothetical protein
MKAYRVVYWVSCGVYSFYEENFDCKAWTKYGAWRKFLKEIKDCPNIFECREYTHTYKRKKNDVNKLVGNIG